MIRKKSTKPASYIATWRGQHQRGGRNKIKTDQEVRAFVEEGLTWMSYQQIADEARERFGVERAPSRSAIQRYWKDRQKNAVSRP